MKGLYIHIPFCNSICTYCDFAKMVSNNKNKELYINKLIEEINSKKNELNDITSVYIGGGTPNSINITLLEKLFMTIKDILFKSSENSIECNPELLKEEQVKLFKKYNINRVSLGVETINDNSIKLINRHHNKDIVINSITLLKNNNINNINIDLIFSLPNTTINDVKNDLNFFFSLDIPHISYYSLILEEHTVLNYLVNNNKIKMISDDDSADMYLYIKNELKSHGYNQYEISNFSKVGFESSHNLLYWSECDYIGCGMSACSFINNKRISNHKTLKKYLDFIVDEVIDISLEDRKKEIFMLGLRKTKGVNIKEYESLYNEDPIIKFNLKKWIDNNFLIIDNDYLKINENKLLLANIIFEEFI